MLFVMVVIFVLVVVAFMVDVIVGGVE